MNVDVERTRRVLERQQAWQEAKRDRADILGLHEITARLDWLARQPAMPPDDPADWLTYLLAGSPAPRGRAVPSERRPREWTRPASLATGERRVRQHRRTPTFTDRQLQIAIDVLDRRATA